MPDIHVNMTFNKDAVVGPANAAMITVGEVLAIACPALDAADLSRSIPIPVGTMNWELGANDLDAEIKGRMYKNFLFSRALQEIARGVRRSMEEAYGYARLVVRSRTLRTWGDFQNFQEFQEAVRVEAAQANFPDLMAGVNAVLREPLRFEGEYSSLNAMRNCLEHDNGTVTLKRTKGEPELVLSLPKLTMLISVEGQESELAPGLFIPAGEHQLVFRHGIREWRFPVGSSVEFSLEDMNEIAVSCWIFTTDLVSKLPDIPNDV